MNGMNEINGMNEMNDYLLDVRNLSVSFHDTDSSDSKTVLSDISLTIRRGEILGVVGESGCGKTVTALSIAGLLPESAQITSGQITLDGEDLLTMTPAKRRNLLGSSICMIFQEPLSALNPLMTIGRQLTEVLVSHEDRRTARAQKANNKNLIFEMLANVGFTNPSRIYNSYPHQISGGQRQRALIAGCLLLKPSLLIADEPTTALDTVTQAQVLDQIRRISCKLNLAVLFISHNLMLVENLCDRVAVMHDSRIVECDSVDRVLHNPKDPYTAELLNNSIFKVFSTANTVSSDINASGAAIPDPETPGAAASGVPPLLMISHVSAGYDGAFFQTQKHSKNILSDVSLSVCPGEIMGLVGTSGGGKTTLARVITGLIPASGGQIYYNGQLTADFSGKKTFYKRPPVGLVFQDPYNSLHPQKTVGWLLEEPLRVHHIGSKITRHEQVLSMMNDVGLSEKYLDYYPNQLSGGLRQRVSIGMSLMLSPSLIIADEPVSALDMSVQTQILQLIWSLYFTRSARNTHFMQPRLRNGKRQHN
jgi:ABC-type glutathione transport system ATPase component